jgi:hypothetical protein
MIKKKKRKPTTIDLTGPDGNAFVLLKLASQLARQIGIPHEPILDEMTMGDYENLIQVFDSYFGKYVILER